MAPDDLFSRDEVLGGLPARRAAATLFHIESRAAHLADQSRRTTDFLLSEDADRRRDLVFLEAFSGGREPPVKPTLQDLERFALQWAPLVPPNPPMRAGIARMLGRKYTFTRAAVPRLRAALGLDDDAVERAYRRQYREDLGAIYAAHVRTADRLRVGWSAFSARLDSLPPFWLTFFLTIAFSFSQAFLALPTGVAGMGAMRGVVLVVAIGLVNVLTMACMAEACARSGDFRYGKAFLGRLVTGYLGGEASLVFSVITALRTFLVMLAGSIGIALTLASSTGIRAEVWIAGVAAAELYYLSRKSQALTITTMLTLVGVNLLLLLLIMGFALGRVEPANLVRASALLRDGTPFDPAVLKLVFGVIVMLYIGHVYVIQCAKIVLPRDPSGRSLIQGSVAGTVVLIAIFTAWILTVNGVVPAARLAREAGTALPSLAERVGPAIHVLGALLVVLLLGMSCLRTSTVMFNLVQERLPTRLRATLTLARRKGDLLFEPRGASVGRMRLGVRYLGLTEGRPRLRIDAQRDGDIERTEVVVAHTWDAADLFARLTGDRVRAGSLVLEVLEAQPEALRVRVTTTMSLNPAGDFSGAERHLGDATELADPLRELVIWLTRRGDATLSEVVQGRGGEPDAVRTTLDELVAQGFIERVDRAAAADPRYRARLAARQGRQVPAEVWAALGQPTPAPEGAPGARHGPSRMRLSAWGLIVGERGQFVVSTSPILLVFLISEALLLTGAASFAGVLGFGGVIANSMTAGIFPVLLLLASRRKGDCVPGAVYRLLGHPAFTASVYALAVGNLFVHGLVIYRDPWTRACALIFGVVVLAVTARMIHAGAFARRSVIELREDMREGGRGVLTIMSGGRPLPAEITLGHPEGDETSQGATATVPALSKVHYAAVQLPSGSAKELKVWVHRVTLAGTSEGLPALVDVRCGEETRRFDLKLSNGQATMKTGGTDCRVRITLAGGAEA